MRVGIFSAYIYLLNLYIYIYIYSVYTGKRLVSRKVNGKSVITIEKWAKDPSRHLTKE